MTEPQPTCCPTQEAGGKRRHLGKIISGLAMIAGIAAIVALTAYQGADEVRQTLVAAGWGILLVTALHMAPTLTSTLAWHSASRGIDPASRTAFLWARMVREAVNGLLPVSQVGGDVVGARLLVFSGMRPPQAGASVLVDLTLEFLTQIVFTVIGLAVLLVDGGSDSKLAVPAAAGIAVAVCAGVGFVLAQRWGLFRLFEAMLARLSAIVPWPALGSLATLHDMAMAIYKDRVGIGRACLWHMASWFLGVVEVWLTLYILGIHTGFAEALILESLGQAIRTAAFLVPGAYGVQEGGYMILAAQLGIPAEIGLSVSLVKRVRELILGIPLMLIWQVHEGRRILAGPDTPTNERP